MLAKCVIKSPDSFSLFRLENPLFSRKEEEEGTTPFNFLKPTGCNDPGNIWEWAAAAERYRGKNLGGGPFFRIVITGIIIFLLLLLLPSCKKPIIVAQ